MMSKNLKYIQVVVISTFLTMLGSCTSEQLSVPEESPMDENAGDVINITLTLDNMGGESSTRSTPSELTYLENYVDPRKVRVLFFDDDDKFLFESKSRWVKQLDPSSDHSSWSVSVPLYSHGNDREEYEWEWDKIRTKLTSNKFKVAILANRPAYQYYPDVDNGSFGDYWFDNTGPNWTVKNSAVYEGADGDVKDVFDIHHSQFDPIYYNKSIENNGGGHAYDFMMGNCTQNGSSRLDGQMPTSSSTSSWLDYSNGDKVRDPYGWGYRKSRLPSTDEPIPMYGIQEFEPLTTWKKGTTIDLSREADGDRKADKPISLLRSVVKLELLVPKGFGVNGEHDVVLFYGNWFTRCEPMDVWTPTDQIWKSDHGSTSSWSEGDCEWKKIWDYGPIAKNGLSDNASDGVLDYKKRMSWIYGLWRKKKGWSFGTTVNTYFDDTYKLITTDEQIDATFPHVFNPCVQRIQRVYIDVTYTDDEYDHYVVYCGERNVNDPSNLTRPGNSGSGNSPVLYWTIISGKKDENGQYTGKVERVTANNANAYINAECAHTFSFPIVDYKEGASVFNCTREGILITDDLKDIQNQLSFPTAGPYLWYPANSQKCVGCSVGAESAAFANGTGMGEYMRRVAGHSTDNQYYRPGDNAGLYSGKDIPLPLVRNHVYRLTVGYTRGAAENPFMISSEVSATEDICFRK